MAEVKRASEMTMEQIEEILEGMNWTEIHKAQVFGDYGDKIVLHTDGEYTVQDQSTHYRDEDAAGVIGYVSTTPWGNCDSSVYFKGFVEQVRDGIENSSRWIEWDDDLALYRHTVTGEEVSEGDVVEIETGLVMDVETAVNQAIEEGEWASEYEEERDAVIHNVEEERRREG